MDGMADFEKRREYAAEDRIAAYCQGCEHDFDLCDCDEPEGVN